MRIGKPDLDAYGYDDMCAQCRHIQTYGRAQPGRQHSERCRKNIHEAMMRDEAGRARFQEEEERVTRRTAEFTGKSDMTPKAAASNLLQVN